MKCYDHQDVDAVAICKSCGKALCSQCAVDLGRGIACKGRCVDDVQMLISLADNNAKTYSAMRGGRAIVSPVFLIVIGLVSAGYGLLSGITLILILGVCFVLFGIVALVLNSRYIKRLAKPEE